MKKYEKEVDRIIKELSRIKRQAGTEEEDEVTVLYLAGLFSAAVAILEIIKGGK